MSLTRDPATTAVCTIVSKNYLAFARTLMNSVAKAHPAWHRYVLLADEVDGYFNPVEENYTLVPLAALPLPQPRQFLFRYTLLELNTAVKPWLLQWLFERAGAQRVVYLDPDIRVYSPLTVVERELAAGAMMTLTPHLLAEIDDDCSPSDLDILRAGCFNLGFLGLARHPELSRFLAWWQRKLTYDCRVDIPHGLFVDQKWMDLVPGMFSDVRIIRDPGYNIAYWNIAQRPMSESAELRIGAGRAPLAFFHFSGLDPCAPKSFSKHQNRFRLGDPGLPIGLIRDYCREVLANGHETCRHWPYAFNRLADGTAIHAGMRQFYRSRPDVIDHVGDDPFRHSHGYLNDSIDGGRQPLVTRLMRAVREHRQDLREAFPDILGLWREDFVHHYVEQSSRDEGIDDAFVRPVRESLRAWRAHRGKAGEEGPMLKLTVAEQPVKDSWQPLRGMVRGIVRAGLSAVPLVCEPQRLKPVYRALKPMRHLLPQAIRHDVKCELLQWVQANVKAKYAAPMLADGLNIVGYVKALSGVGESARLCAQAAGAAGLPFSLHDAATPSEERGRHRVNVMHVNADQTPIVRQVLGDAFFKGRHTVGVWHWELPHFPDRWLDAFAGVDEIWAPSRFIQDGLAARSPVPIVRIPHAILFEPSASAARRDFGLPDDSFLFLMMFDVRSFQERKNPEAAIAAFQKAFGHRGATLVIKVNDSHGDGSGIAAAAELVRGARNVHILGERMDRQRTYDLLSLCDCVVSLHRSEGYGLVLAEAMYLGKPVIATGWSGNMEFMTADNSCPVDYRLVRLERDVGPYDRGQTWAEPDVDFAAEMMRKVATDAAYARKIGDAGMATIRGEFSPQRVGALIRKRLNEIHRFRSAPTMRAAA